MNCCWLKVLFIARWRFGLGYRRRFWWSSRHLPVVRSTPNCSATPRISPWICAHSSLFRGTTLRHPAYAGCFSQWWPLWNDTDSVACQCFHFFCSLFRMSKQLSFASSHSQPARKAARIWLFSRDFAQARASSLMKWPIFFCNDGGWFLSPHWSSVGAVQPHFQFSSNWSNFQPQRMDWEPCGAS